MVNAPSLPRSSQAKPAVASASDEQSSPQRKGRLAASVKGTSSTQKPEEHHRTVRMANPHRLENSNSASSGSSIESFVSAHNTLKVAEVSTPDSSAADMNERRKSDDDGAPSVHAAPTNIVKDGKHPSARSSVDGHASTSWAGEPASKDVEPISAAARAASSVSMSGSDSGQGRAPSSAGSFSSNGHTMHAARKTAGTLRGSTRARRGQVILPQSGIASHLTSPTQGGSVFNDGDAFSVASTHSLSQNEEDGWESESLQALDAEPLIEGAIPELPSVAPPPPPDVRASTDEILNAQRRRFKATNYDWASFAYAYARGQWDPLRIPRPPGKSTLVTGAETRITTKLVSRDEAPDTSEAEESFASAGPSNLATRRLSLDYRSVDGDAEPAKEAIKPVWPPNIFETSGDSAMSQQSKDRSTEEHQAHSAASMDASGNAREQLGVAASKHVLPQQPRSTSDRFKQRSALDSTDDALPKLGTVSPFELLSKVTNSAPDVDSIVQAAKMMEEKIRRAGSALQGPHSTGISGAKTDSVLMTQKSLRGDDNMSSDWPVTAWDAKSWSFQSKPGDRAQAEVPNLAGPHRPSLSAQTSGMSGGASHTSRGSDQVLVSPDRPHRDDSVSPSRPEPIPLQIAELADARKSSNTTIQPDDHGGSDPSIEMEKRVIEARQYQTLQESMPQRADSVSFAKPGLERSKTHRDDTYATDTNGGNDIAARRASTGDPMMLPKNTGTPERKSQSNLPTLKSSIESPNLSSYINAGRQLEDFFNKNGYLSPMQPPDEVHRRQVLRRYGPAQMHGYHNFERVAHLVKLVFNVQRVFVNLVGADQVDVKANVGPSSDSTGNILPSDSDRIVGRACTFSGHVILQKSAEPLVVLDAHQDWRFACNPMVTGPNRIRFYAGCPLRTADGYNLGSLCVSDDKPWTEFGPRQRHTLKEFAQLIMRELELVRDTLHLRIRDRMQHSIEHFTRQSIEMDSADNEEGPGIHEIYNSAVESMRDALRATGAVMFDLTQFEAVVTANPDGSESVDGTGRIFLPSPFQFPEVAPLFAKAQQDIAGGSSQDSTLSQATAQAKVDGKVMPPIPILGSSVVGAPLPSQGRHVSLAHHIKIAEFMQRYRQGHYFGYIPAPFRDLMPPEASNVLLVPIFGLNRQPFALLCAYSRASEGDVTLEDIQDAGLQYLRAMGTIILSAVLKKDIMMADQAKSHFISNISHELRTPLHGILAAAELLNETRLSTTQVSYLDTVEACGKSLLELVNHVLDFTKLSGSSHNKTPVPKPMQRSDLVQLVQEVCESSWIGQMAKNLDSARHAGIGSAYAKGSEASSPTSTGSTQSLQELIGSVQVETVIDVSMRAEGWFVKCDAGGIRRVLMNLIGNSLKFTTNGFVHVAIREVQSDETHIIAELSVTDTGKGISREFLEEQLFHPFTQENHLGPGTGLGLSIVNSIVQSPAINGKIDVWSTQGHGTEIRVTCELELCPKEESEAPIYMPRLNLQHQRSITFIGFPVSSRGASDLKDVMRTYFEDWWRFKVLTEDDDEDGDLILLNDDITKLDELAEERSGRLPPVVFLSSLRGDVRVTSACERYEEQGGVVRMVFKPTGPARLEQATEYCLQCFERGQRGESMVDGEVDSTPLPSPHQRVQERNASSNYTINDNIMNIADDDAITPRGIAIPSDVQMQKSAMPDHMRPPLRPTLSSEQRFTTPHHISPGPPGLPDSILPRRNSAARSDDGLLLRRRESIGAASANSKDGSTSSTSASDKGNLSRPLLPARSITYHEPHLRRQILLSPLRSPHNLREHSEAQDYFGPSAVAATPAHARSNAAPSTSSPSTPGSVVSLEGGEGAILKTAINTAGIVRPLHGPVAQKKRLQILSVEDNSINRRVLAAFFGKMDVDFVEATNGEEGVRQFENYPPFFFDVIFMDLSMPVLDGIGATLQIRKVEAERFRNEHANTLAWLRGGRQHIPTSLSLSSSASSGAPPEVTSSSTSSSTSANTTSAASARSTSSNTVKHHYPTQTSPLILHTPGGSRPSLQARAKIFALTGRSSDDDKRRAFSAGADGFIVKPLSFKVLSSLLNNVNAYRR